MDIEKYESWIYDENWDEYVVIWLKSGFCCHIFLEKEVSQKEKYILGNNIYFKGGLTF